MKELYAAIQQGEIETLRHKIRLAEQQGQPELEWQGKFVSTTYATYLVQFSDTFLKELTDKLGKVEAISSITRTYKH